MFKGKSFHTNNWIYSFDYTNKKVAIIDSGASAAQVIPAIAPTVKHLSVFQRTPHWVMARPDHDFSTLEQKLLNINFISKLVRLLIYLSLEIRIIGFRYSLFFLKLIAQKSTLRFIKKNIKNDELRRKVTPNYVIGCKRIILSNSLYPALARENVTLFDKTQEIGKITGIITTDGQQVDLDLIIYSTGYETSNGAVAFPVIGKNGFKLTDLDYPRAYLGTSLPGFPNFFMLSDPNTVIGHTSLIFVLESQLNYVVKAIKAAENKNAKVIEVIKKLKKSIQKTFTNK